MSFNPYELGLSVSGAEGFASALGSASGAVETLEAKVAEAGAALTTSGIPGLGGFGAAATAAAPLIGKATAAVGVLKATLGPVVLAITAAQAAWSLFSSGLEALKGPEVAAARVDMLTETMQGLARAFEARREQVLADVDDVVKATGSLVGVSVEQATALRTVATQAREEQAKLTESTRRLADLERELGAVRRGVADATRDGTFAVSAKDAELRKLIATEQQAADAAAMMVAALDAERSRVVDSVRERRVRLGLVERETSATRGLTAALAEQASMEETLAEWRRAGEADLIRAAREVADMRRQEVRDLEAREELLGTIAAAEQAMQADAGGGGLSLYAELLADGMIPLHAAEAAEATDGWTESLLGLARAGESAAGMMREQVAPVLGGIARGFAAAAVHSALFGGSLKGAVNEVAKAATAEAAIGALIQTAKGFAALATGNPAAALHFKAAGIFAAVGIAAGAIAAATGGLRDAAGGAAGASSTPAPSRNELEGPDRRESSAVNISVNFGGQPLSTRRDIHEAVAESLDHALRGRSGYRLSSESRLALGAA